MQNKIDFSFETKPKFVSWVSSFRYWRTSVTYLWRWRPRNDPLPPTSLQRKIITSSGTDFFIYNVRLFPTPFLKILLVALGEMFPRVKQIRVLGIGFYIPKNFSWTAVTDTYMLDKSLTDIICQWGYFILIFTLWIEKVFINWKKIGQHFFKKKNKQIHTDFFYKKAKITSTIFRNGLRQ